ncbi:putative transcription factor FET5, partial [Pseudoloma neurophilia]
MHSICVIGPAGCGKTTFCLSLYKEIFRENKVLINLDPASRTDNTYSYDIRDYFMENSDSDYSNQDNDLENFENKKTMSLYDQLQTEGVLGPNGAVLHALDRLSQDIELITDNINNSLVIIDMPGQIEIFLHSRAFVTIIDHFKSLGPLLVVSLFDCFNFLDSDRFMINSINSIIINTRIEAPCLQLIT